MLLLMIDIVTVSFAQSALNKSHKRIKRRLLILTIADQGNLISPFYTGSQYTQHTLGIRRHAEMLWKIYILLPRRIRALRGGDEALMGF